MFSRESERGPIQRELISINPSFPLHPLDLVGSAKSHLTPTVTSMSSHTHVLSQGPFSCCSSLSSVRAGGHVHTDASQLQTSAHGRGGAAVWVEGSCLHAESIHLHSALTKPP